MAVGKAVIIGKVAVKVVPDTSDFIADTKDNIRAIQERLPEVSLNVKADLGKAERELRDLQNKYNGKNISFDVKTDDLAAKTKLSVLGRNRNVSLFVEVNEASILKAEATLKALSGQRMLGNLVGDFKEWLGDLDKAVPKLASIATGIAGIAGYAIAGSSNLFSLTSSLAAVAGAGLALPGLFAGIVTGLGVTLLGFRDLKKALPDVYAEFQNIKHVITKDFWSGATDGIRNLLTVYIPQLGSSAKEIGSFWGTLGNALAAPFKAELPTMFDNLNKSIGITSDNTGVFADIITKLGTTGSQYLPRLATWFGKISTTFDTWIGKLLGNGGMQKLIDGGITALSQLGVVLRETTGAILDIGKAAERGGGTTLGTLADYMTRLHTAVASPGFAEGFVAIVDGAHQMVDTIVGLAGPAFDTLFKALSGSLPGVLVSVGEAIGTIAGALAQALASPAIQGGLTTMFQAIATGAQELAPALQPAADIVGVLANVIGTMFVNFMPLITALLQAVAPLAVAIEPILEQLINILSPALLAVIQALTPLLTGLANWVTTHQTLAGSIAGITLALGAGMAGVIRTVSSVQSTFDKIDRLLFTVAEDGVKSATLLGRIFGPLIAGVKGLGAALWSLATNPVVLIIAAIIAVVAALVLFFTKTELGRKLWGEFIDWLGKAWQWLKGVAENVWNGILTAVQAVVDWYSANVAPIFKAVGDAISTAWTAVSTGAQVAWGAIQTAIASVVGWLQTYVWPVFQALGAVFSAVWDAVWQTVSFFWTTLLQPFLQGMADQWNYIWGLVQTGWTLASEFIQGGIQGFIDFITPIWDAFTKVLTVAWDALWGYIQIAWAAVGPPLQAAIGVFVSYIQMAWQNLVTVLSAVWNVMLTVLKMVWDNIVALVQGALQILAGIFRAIADVLRGNWSGAWDEIKNIAKIALDTLGAIIGNGVAAAAQIFGTVKGAILDVFSNIGDWLTDSGKALLDGFVDGIQGAAKKAKDVVSGVLSDIRKLFPFSPAKEGPFSGKGWVLYSGMSISDGMADGIKARAGAAKAAAEDLARQTAAALNGTEIVGATVNNKTLVYNAAPGSSLGAAEDLYGALGRARGAF